VRYCGIFPTPALIDGLEDPVVEHVFVNEDTGTLHRAFFSGEQCSLVMVWKQFVAKELPDPIKEWRRLFCPDDQMEFSEKKLKALQRLKDRCSGSSDIGDKEKPRRFFEAMQLDYATTAYNNVAALANRFKKTCLCDRVTRADIDTPKAIKRRIRQKETMLATLESNRSDTAVRSAITAAKA